MALISEKLNKGLDDIVTKFFYLNRIADRGVSVIDVKFVMNNSAQIIHQKLAHAFPLIADEVSEFQGKRGCLTIYGLTPLDDTDYASPMDFFERLMGEMLVAEALVGDAIELAIEEDDYTTRAFLQKFLVDLIPYTHACMIIVDKARAYGGDWMRFDHDFDDFDAMFED